MMRRRQEEEDEGPDPLGLEWQKGVILMGRKLIFAYLRDDAAGVVALLPYLPDRITLEDPTPAEQQRRRNEIWDALDEIRKELRKAP